MVEPLYIEGCSVTVDSCNKLALSEDPKTYDPGLKHTKTMNTGFEAFFRKHMKLLSECSPIRHFSIATPFEISENKGLSATCLISGEMG
jgi:hypothetical protein